MLVTSWGTILIENVSNHLTIRVPKAHKDGASLITGMEYGTERWNGKWNGTVNIHSCS